MRIKTPEYQLYLFDMDGLLVDTDKLHYQAYQRFLECRNYKLTWSFQEYLQIAHSSSSSLKEAIYRLFPDLFEKEPSWDVLYGEKKQAYMEILQESPVVLMPGAERIIRTLLELGKTICVVSHSTKDLVEIIHTKQPLLTEIEGWIVREEYEKAKPDSACYKLAIDRWAYPGFHIIGFENSARGLVALIGSSATGVLVSPYQYAQLEAYEGRYTQVASLEEIELLS